MSYISEALKKAEREKQGARPTAHYELAREERRKKLSLRWALFAFFILLCVGLAVPLTYKFIHRPTKATVSLPSLDIDKRYAEAMAAQKAGNLTEAEAAYRQILSIKRDHLDSLNNLGVVCMLSGNNTEAESLFKKALSLNPNHLYGNYNLACLFAREGRPSDALFYLKKAVEIDSRVKAWSLQDKDFILMRNDNEFKKLVEISEIKEREK